jgi:hypothetical protein
VLLNLGTSGTVDFRILTSYWSAGGISAILELLILESSLPVGWQEERLILLAVTFFSKLPILQYSEGASYIVKTRSPEPQNLAQATFRTCRDQTLEYAGRKYPQIHN